MQLIVCTRKDKLYHCVEISKNLVYSKSQNLKSIYQCSIVFCRYHSCVQVVIACCQCCGVAVFISTVFRFQYSMKVTSISRTCGFSSIPCYPCIQNANCLHIRHDVGLVSSRPSHDPSTKEHGALKCRLTYFLSNL